MIFKSSFPFPIKQYVRIATHHLILADLGDTAIIELVPSSVQRIQAVGSIVTTEQTTVVVYHPVKVVYQRLVWFIC